MRSLAIALLMALTGAAEAEPKCAADEVRTLKHYPMTGGCPDGEAACRRDCEAGKPERCLALAVLIEADPARGDEADGLFRRACVLGASGGCTNHAAKIWASRDDAESRACARRLFEKACAARNHHACGMQGRVLLEDAKDEAAIRRARRQLEKSCKTIGGFPCHSLAHLFETGKHWPADPERARSLLVRACATGDDEACAEVRAAETSR